MIVSARFFQQKSPSARMLQLHIQLTPSFDGAIRGKNNTSVRISATRRAIYATYAVNRIHNEVEFIDAPTCLPGGYVLHSHRNVIIVIIESAFAAGLRLRLV